MTDIADLIAEAREAAKRADWYMTGESPLLRALADALEAAERRADAAREEVGYEKRMREFISGERDRFIDLKRAADQRAAEYAAVIEQVRAYLEEGKGAYAPDLLDILATAPRDVLREHDAKVRAETLREAHADLQAYTDSGAPFGHRPVEEFLLRRADRIEKGSGL